MIDVSWQSKYNYIVYNQQEWRLAIIKFVNTLIRQHDTLLTDAKLKLLAWVENFVDLKVTFWVRKKFTEKNVWCNNSAIQFCELSWSIVWKKSFVRTELTVLILSTLWPDSHRRLTSFFKNKLCMLTASSLLNYNLTERFQFALLQKKNFV